MAATNMDATSQDSDNLHEPEDVGSEAGWDDVESDDEELAVQGLFGTRQFDTVKQLVENTKTTHNIDLVKLRNDFNLDFLDIVKLVNYIRSFPNDASVDLSSKEVWSDDKYLKPVLEGDPLLYELDGVLEAMAKSTYGDVKESEEKDAEKKALLDRIDVLTNQLQTVETQWQKYKMTVEEQLDQRWQNAEPTNAPLSSNSNGYFKGYAYTEIHATMLKDSVRTSTYRDFIYTHKDLFADKVILDVGCGTGILSLFAAKAGAKVVYAVDNSDIIHKAQAIVFENGLQDIVRCYHGKIEDLELPIHDGEVDIIISEWMGYALLFEAMLPSVLRARDKYLKPRGLMVPSHVTLRIGPWADEDYVTDQLTFWRDVYGFKMGAMLEEAYDEAIVMPANEKTMAGRGQTFWVADLHTVKVQDLEFRARRFDCTLDRDVDRLDGFVVWFDVFFAAEIGTLLEDGAEAMDWTSKGKIAFSTGPRTPQTHWQQTVLLVDPKNDTDGIIHPKDGDEGQSSGIVNDTEHAADAATTRTLHEAGLKAGQVLSGEISFKPDTEDERGLHIQVSWTCGERGASREQQWALL